MGGKALTNVLLIIIACVLLFGREQVMATLTTGAVVTAITLLLILCILISITIAIALWKGILNFRPRDALVSLGRRTISLVVWFGDLLAAPLLSPVREWRFCREAGSSFPASLLATGYAALVGVVLGAGAWAFMVGVVVAASRGIASWQTGHA
jgi:energy-converting hydrogenase Eha subunit A